MKITNFRDILAILFLPFMLIWIGLIAFLIKVIGMTVIEALGLGVATGVFVTCFSNMWQFYYRQRTPEEGTPQVPPKP